MINFDDLTKENINEHNAHWPLIPDYPSGILVIGGSGSGKTNSLFNLINQQPNIDKIFEAKWTIWSKISIFNWQTRKYRLKAF